MGDVKLTLKQYQARINSELEKFFDKKIQRVKGISPHIIELTKNLREFTLRDAKRIRPILLIFGYKCIKDPKNESDILKAALAAELMESFLLIHDDIIDNDSIRRKKPTLHKIYEERSKRYNTDHTHFGKSMAIIGGDILATLGSEILLSTNFKDSLKLKAIEKFNRVVINTGFGELLDVISEVDNKISEKDILKIHELKTAKYTIEGPLHIGAILAGAKEKHLSILSKYAIPLGKAFQIQDDILGMYGDQKKTGKPVGSDLKEGKKTLLILKALEKSNLKDRLKIKRALGNKKLTTRQLNQIRKIIMDTGSLQYSKDMAKQLAEKAKSAISRSSFKKEGKEFLIQIADYIINRDL